MLDFYTIEDDRPKPNYPAQQNLKYVGGLDNKTFHNLQQKGIIDDRFDYYSDFRLGTQVIAEIRKRIETKKMEKDSDVQLLLNLLEIAEQENSGLIAYGD